MSSELQLMFGVMALLLGAFILYEVVKRLSDSVPSELVKILANLTSEVLKQASLLAEKTANPIDDYAVKVVKSAIERDVANDEDTAKIKPDEP